MIELFPKPIEVKLGEVLHVGPDGVKVLPECECGGCCRHVTQPKRVGRAAWVCPKSGRDISLQVLFLAECLIDSKTQLHDNDD